MGRDMYKLQYSNKKWLPKHMGGQLLYTYKTKYKMAAIERGRVWDHSALGHLRQQVEQQSHLCGRGQN